MTPANKREMTMAEALRDAMRLAMQEDPRVFLLGEDIGIKDGFGGGFTVTLGLSDEFGHERVMDSPPQRICDHRCGSWRSNGGYAPGCGNAVWRFCFRRNGPGC
jgi:hypothetical protein